MSTFLPPPGMSRNNPFNNRDQDPLGMGRGGTDLPPGLQVIQSALQKKIGTREAEWARRTRPALNRDEEDKLDEMREVMAGFRTDYELTRWSITSIFAFPTQPSSVLFPDPRLAPASMDEVEQSLLAAGSRDTMITAGPFSPLYPDLLLTLFLLLRDTHHSPHAALNVFSLACITAHSYVAGCTTSLYNEVMRTRWMEGDVESVAKTLEEMRNAGLKINEATQDIVQAIGDAIRIDELRAEERVLSHPGAGQAFGSSASSDMLNNMLDAFPPTDTSELAISRCRLFSRAQIEAWSKMDSMIEESLDERMQRKRVKDAEAIREWEQRRNAKEGVSSSNAYFSGSSLRRDGDRSQSALSSSRYEESPDPREQEEEEVQASRSRVQERPAFLDYDDEAIDDGIDASWEKFPIRDRTDEEREFRESVAEVNRPHLFDNLPSPPVAATRTPIPGRPSTTPASSTPSFYNRFNEPGSGVGGDSLVERGSHSTDRDKEKPRRDISRGYGFRDAPQNLDELLPKRPSIFNPFKIRRKGLSKLEKARFDKPHPMMSWKK